MSVSVVIPTRNRGAIVRGAVEAVLAQTHGDLEVVVVDDGSTDDTRSVVLSFDDDRVVYVAQEHAGASAARNAGTRAARGSAMAFLDDDDEPVPGWLATLSQPMTEDESVAVVCCASVYRKPDGTFIRVYPLHNLGPAFRDHRGQFDTGTYLVRREVFDQSGGFAVGLASGEHHELGMRLLDVLAERGLRMATVDEPLVTIVQRPSVARVSNHPRHQYDSSMYMLEHHGERLARSPRLLGNYLAIAAVSAARLDDYHDARRLLCRAIRADPRFLTHYGRLLLAALRPLGRRVWRVDQWQRASPSA